MRATNLLVLAAALATVSFIHAAVHASFSAIVPMAYMDEVLYFQRRAARWCEPPIFYAFVREDLSDTEKARSNAMRPLVKMLNDLKRVDATDGDAYRFARCLTSLRVLANHSPEFYALDADGVAERRLVRALAASPGHPAHVLHSRQQPAAESSC